LDFIWIILDHPRSAPIGLRLVLKFVARIYSFGDIAIFIFQRFGLFKAIFGDWGIFPPNDVTHRSNPQKALPYAETHRLSHKRENQFSDLGAFPSKKDRTEQDSQKSHKVEIFRLYGRSHTVPIRTKICMVGSLPSVITCAKFQCEIFRGYDFTGGRISHFPTDFHMGITTVQLYCAACDY